MVDSVHQNQDIRPHNHSDVFGENGALRLKDACTACGETSACVWRSDLVVINGIIQQRAS